MRIFPFKCIYIRRLTYPRTFNYLSVLKADVEKYLKLGSSDLCPVVDAYEHALMARVPRPRYLVGPKAFLWRILPLLPEWLLDKLIEAGNPDRAIPACVTKPLH